MATDKSPVSFLGRGWSFPPSFDQPNKEVRLVTEEEDIRQSLYILLSTTPGERTMQPSYGCALKSMLYENMDENHVTRLRDDIERAILFFETRISVQAIELDTQQIIEGVLRISIDYLIRRTNTRSNIVYPFYVLEGTNVSL